MKKLSLFVVSAGLLSNCELTNYVPPVTSQMAAVKKGQHVELTTLHEGRALFVGRCIECHTLPSIWRYSADDWPEIVDSMAQRASLKPAERDAIVAYIRAVRSMK
jgi:mono/diheme cytochrome c family protein